MLPDMLEAKKRTNKETPVYYDAYEITEELSKIGTGKKYYIETYGCQMNVHDTENIKALLEELNFEEIQEMEKADLILLNTCAIRENAHNKVFGMLGRIKHLKEEKKDIITCLCGCMAQEEIVAKKLKEKYKWVDVVFGTHNIHELPKLLGEAMNKKKQVLNVYSKEGEIYENLPVKRDSKYKAWVNIMYGCDKFCTYCIVPYTRGKQRSRKKEDILLEVRELVNNGYKEVTLLGQNVNAYGKDLNTNETMADLLREVANTNIPRVRFITSHPWDFTDEMIEVIKEYPNIMPYIHLPIQSGSNKILKLMNRRYTKEEYMDLFYKIKKNIPNVSITTDIIVGFPSETEEDFEETLDIVRTLKFDLAYTFNYSKRESTPAALLDNQVEEEVKFDRLHRLNALVNEIALEHNQKYQDKIVSVLLEGESEKEGYLTGYTDTMKLVNVKADKEYIGLIANVKITSTKTWSLDGEIVDGKK